MKTARFAAALLAALAAPVGASAEVASPFYKVVSAGHRVKVGWYISVDPTCRSMGLAQVNPVSQPHGGELETRSGSDYPAFAANNVRSACNKRRLPSTILFYHASANFVGTDDFEVEAVYPDGSAQRYHYEVNVR